MRVGRSLRLFLLGLTALVLIALAIGVFVFEGVVISSLMKDGDPAGKEPILVPAFLILGAVLMWMGVRRLLRLRRMLSGEDTQPR